MSSRLEPHTKQCLLILHRFLLTANVFTLLTALRSASPVITLSQMSCNLHSTPERRILYNWGIFKWATYIHVYVELWPLKTVLTKKLELTWNELIVSWMKSLICLESPSTCSSVMKVNTNSWIPNNGISTSVDLANLKKKTVNCSTFSTSLLQKRSYRYPALEWY